MNRIKRRFDWVYVRLVMRRYGRIGSKAVLRARRLRGSQGWVPLTVGFWLPLSMVLKLTAIGLPIELPFATLYSALA